MRGHHRRVFILYKRARRKTPKITQRTRARRVAPLRGKSRGREREKSTAIERECYGPRRTEGSYGCCQRCALEGEWRVMGVRVARYLGDWAFFYKLFVIVVWGFDAVLLIVSW